MIVPVKLFGFVVWLLSLHCGQCQECLRDSITYQYVEQLPEASYESGKTVKVTCQTGFTGMYRLNCENGKWKENIVRPCQKKKCSHPGAVANGDFQLVDETEFVFGARVVYFCKKGFEMTSRINERTCRSQGWDNAVPVCEAIHANEDVTATEPCHRHSIKYEYVEPLPEASYESGKTVKVTCQTGFTGMYRLNCENGEWKESIARPCQKKKCSHPGDVANGDFQLVDETEFVFGARVVYFCKKGFEMTSRINERTCRSQGWDNAVPVCEAIHTDEDVTATENQEECRDLSVKNGVTYSQTSDKQEMFYSCNKSFKPFTGKWWSSVTCSKGSWSDVPRCIREEECGALPSVQNGKVNPNDQETAEVVCEPGFVSPQRFIKCISGTWEEPRCNVGENCGIPPYVENAVITSKPQEFYVYGSSVTYACKRPLLMSGKRTVFCNNGKWEATPTCEVLCPRPHENSMVLESNKDMFDNKEIVKYNCLKPYTEIPGGEWTCENGKWTGEFVCTSMICPPPPYVENGDFVSRNPDVVPTEVKYQCQAGYVLSEQQRYYKCENRKWQTPPRCLKPCEITSSLLEKHNMKPIPQTLYIQHSRSHYFYCKDGFFVQRTRQHYFTLTCSDGNFNIESCQKYN